MRHYSRQLLAAHGLRETLIRQYGEREGFAVIRTAPGLFEGATTWIFLEPHVKLVADTTGVFLTTATASSTFDTHPLRALDELVSAREGEPIDIPWSAGGLAYELLAAIESVPIAPPAERRVPEMIFYRYRRVIELVDGASHAIDHQVQCPAEPPFWDAGTLAADDTTPCKTDTPYRNSALVEAQEILAQSSSTTRMRYEAAVQQIREQIGRGNVYQVNLSQSFAFPIAMPPSTLWERLSRRVPAPREAFIRFSWNDQPCAYLSSSPELFFERRQHRVRCSPIKGTRRRGETPTEDKQLSMELLSSEKDRAELAMIVDLVRNDLGRIADIGTVRVLHHAELTTLPTVHHLTSHIEATVEPRLPLSQVIRALFPCGSITGAPKIAAMKKIHELEPTARGIFTGAIGFVCNNSDAHFNVAIRSGSVVNGVFCFGAGGGVVWDSDPAAEYLESIIKARGLIPPR